MRKPNMKLSTSVLVLLNGALLVLAGWAWRTGQERVHEPEHVIAHRLAAPDLGALNPPAAATVDLATIRENAVFHNRRSYYQVPPPSQVIATPDYEFAGTMSLPQGRKVAFVKKKSDQSNRSLHVGDDLDGWRVESIDLARVVIVRDEQRVDLKSTSSASALGLIHGEVSPHVAQSGMRAMRGASPANVRALVDAPIVVRTYQPPPH
jgi:hypothetical protein